MMKIRTLSFILILLLSANYELHAQKKYFNSKNEPIVQLDSCSYYEITYLDSLDNNKRYVEIYTCSDKLIKIVPFYYNQIDGAVISFDTLGILNKEENYMNGVRNGISKKYWSNGKIRRQELFIDDKFTSGKCFNEAGKEVKYLASDREMKLINKYHDILDYIAENMKYPIEDLSKGISGRVRISFSVNEIGKVEDVVILDKVSTTIDAEATRLIKQLPIESPEVRDDIPVSVKFVVPIVFEEE